MKKFQKKTLIVGLIAGCILAGATPCFAYNGGAGTEVDSFANAPRSLHTLVNAENDALSHRLEDIRFGEKTGGVWIRSFTGKAEGIRHGNMREFDQTYRGFVVGVGGKVQSTSRANVYAGGFLGTTKSDVDYSMDFTTGREYMQSDISTGYLGAYGIYHQPKNDFYVGTTLKWGTVNQEHNLKNPGSFGYQSDDDRSSIWSISFDSGRRFFLGNQKSEKEGFYLEPQARLSVGEIGGTDFYDSFSKIGSSRFAQTRLGLQAGYEIKNNKNPINIYGKAAWVSDFGNKPKVSIDASRISTPLTHDWVQSELDRNWLVYGLGISATIKEHHSLHLDFQRSSGAEVNQKFQISGGYKYQW
jgi:outer membrane autotransporter barrel domain